MIHTLVIGLKIDKSVFYKIKNTFKHLGTEKKNNYTWILKTRELWQCGFDEIELIKNSIQKSNGYFYYIKIIVNPSVILFGSDDIGIISFKETIIYNLERKLNLLFKNKLKVELDIRDFSTNRIDYAFDYSTEYVEELLRLFHKGNDIFNFNLQNYPHNESLYAVSKTSTINFYNKQNQLQKKILNGKQIVTAEQIESAKNILRLEMQCKTNKIKYTKKKYNQNNTNPMSMFNPEISNDIISYYVKRIISDCNFYSYKEAERIISNSDYKDSMKSKLIYLLKLITNSNSISKAKQNFISGNANIKYNGKIIPFGGSESTFNSYIKKVKALSVNPITIPRDWGIDFIENPLSNINTMVSVYSLDAVQ